jgi:type II secretory pathway component HofQ
MPLDEERTAVTDLQPAIIRTKTVKDNLGTINILEPVKAETEYTGHKVAIGFHNIDIRTAMDMFSQISGREINVADEIDGIVTVNVGTPEPWDKIFSELLERNRLEAVFSGNTIRVIPKSIDEQQY